RVKYLDLYIRLASRSHSSATGGVMAISVVKNVKAALSGQVAAVYNHILDDSVATVPQQKQAMSDNAIFQAQTWDGRVFNYRFDTERCNPDLGILYILRA